MKADTATRGENPKQNLLKGSGRRRGCGTKAIAWEKKREPKKGKRGYGFESKLNHQGRGGKVGL